MPASALNEQRALSCSRLCRGRDVRCQASSLISTFSTVPARKAGGGGHIHFRAATFNLAHASGPLGKDEGTRSYWESPFRGSGWPRACISDWLLGEAQTPL